MAGRFNRVRLRHIWAITKRGPTEVGYAYFRARRRRRNIADDDPEITESDELALSGLFDADEELLAANASLIDRYRQSDAFDIRSVQWFLPYFHHAYFGGTYTLLRFADHFARVHGVENRFHCYDVRTRGAAPSMERRAIRAFPALAGSRFTSASDSTPEQLPEADAAVATLWSSAYSVLRMPRARARFYFVQDNEPQFYPAGSAWALAEETYRFGFPGIVNTPGLAEVYRGYGNPAIPFVPAVDRERYHPAAETRDPSAPVRVFFYARPSSPRNAFGLGLRALHILKQRYGDRVEVICAGDFWKPGAFGVDGLVHNLGVLESLDEVAALYRSCDIGLVFMLTKHPSYQPLEFMASGVATVSNFNPATSWLLRDGENCLLTRPYPTAVAERIGQLVEDPGLRSRVVKAGLDEVRRYHWEDQIERVWDAMCLRDPIFSLKAPLRPEALHG
jgi:glycosyltransferase involved in cell wall biosynthesis